jgi:hypothetical protein
MKAKKTTFLLFVTILLSAYPIVAQEVEEDETKMIREVVAVDMEKPVVAAVAAVPIKEEPLNKKKKNKHQVEETPEAVATDTAVGGMVPASVQELKKRGTAWMAKKNKHFKKLDATGGGDFVECTVSWMYHTKALNPQAPVDGTITMTLIIDCREGKYRYTISNIKHNATNVNFSGGDCYEEIPACGTMKLPTPEWKKIRSFAMQKANQIAFNLKEFMREAVKDKKNDW